MKSDGIIEFLAMGGYGFYVWTSYAVAALAIALEIVAVRARVRAAVQLALQPDHAVPLAEDTQ
jgi:heme exporter protein D